MSVESFCLAQAAELHSRHKARHPEWLRGFSGSSTDFCSPMRPSWPLNKTRPADTDGSAGSLPPATPERKRGLTEAGGSAGSTDFQSPLPPPRSSLWESLRTGASCQYQCRLPHPHAAGQQTEEEEDGLRHRWHL